jgi:pimeloyl-ACP methyl ester carboxylesterase
MALYDGLLDQWPVPYAGLAVDTRHGATFVVASGEESKPPLVLLHGAGTNSAVWGADVVDYAHHYRVYAVDLLGEPGKSAPHRPAWDGPAYGEWLEDVFDQLGLEKPAVAGISQGGWAALKLAVRRPARVEKLVLMAPAGVIPDRKSFLLRAIPLTLLGRWGARRLARMTFGDQPVPDGVEDIVVTITSHFKPRVGIVPLFSDEELRRLTMPTLLLGGTQDIIRDTNKIAARLQALLPEVQVIVIPGAGHALLDTTGYILPFLTQEDHSG